MGKHAFDQYLLCDCDKISNRNGGGVKFLALFMRKDNKGPLSISFSLNIIPTLLCDVPENLFFLMFMLHGHN